MSTEQEEKEQNWYFTFSVNDECYSKNYAKFWGTKDTSRKKMVSLFGDKWSFQYGSLEEFNPEQWGLTELDITDNKKYLEYGDAISFSDKLSKDRLWAMYEILEEQYKAKQKELEKDGIILKKLHWELFPSDNGSFGMLLWRAYADKK